ncbi:MAG TPA: TonB-dependent receptor [Oceanipulchritudo sp.]|nr:TonB-dependent receptor [Oceanipulchritudo sp.]
MIKRTRGGLCRVLTLILGTAAGVAEAQDDEIQELEEVIFLEQTDVNNVVPDIEIEGLFGPSSSPYETPRSVSVVSSEMLERYGMESTRDFIAAVPGTFTPSNYGVDGGLKIRGEDSETYFRGFRKLQNTALFPTPFGATDRVEIVRGAASVVHGPSRNSGYLNYVPKTARTDRAQIIREDFGEISGTYGSYEKKNLSLLYGFPFETGETRSSALVYVEREDSGSFYKNDFDEWWVVQGGVDLVLSDTLSIVAGAMWFDWDGKNNVGWNRLTPELLRDGTYLGGQVPDINGLDGVIGETISVEDMALASGADAAYNVFFPFLPDPFPPLDPASPEESLWRIENPGITQLDRDETLVDTIDYIWLRNLTAYLDFVYTPDSNLTVRNQSFFDTYETENYVSYGFTGFFDSSVFENRTTADFDWELSESITSSHSAGVSFRYFDGIGKNAFGQGFQHADRRDLSAGATPSDRSPNALFSDRGWSLNEDTEYLNAGAFVASKFALNETVFIDTGLRWDYFDSESVDTGQFAGGFAEASDTSDEFSYNISLSAELGNMRPYISYADSVYLLVDANGGTLAPANIDNGTYLADAELLEAGVKGSFFEDRLYAAIAVYTQENSRTDQFGAPVGLESEGVEIEARWAPTTNFSMTAAATWVDSVQTNDAFVRVPLSEVNRQLDADIKPEEFYGGVVETVVTQLGLPLENEVPGEPDYVLSLYSTYAFENGFGVTGGVTYVPDVPAGWFDDIILPDYYLANVTFFYSWNNWSASLAIKNVLDEEYFSPQVFWDDLLTLPSEGRTVDLTLTYKW